MDVEKTKARRIIVQPSTVQNMTYKKSEKWWILKKVRVYVKINPDCHRKATCNEKNFSPANWSQIQGPNLWNATFGAQLKLGHFGKYNRSTSKVFKCGTEIGWGRSVGPIVWKANLFLRVEKAGNTLHTVKRRNANWISSILPRICLLKHDI